MGEKVYKPMHPFKQEGLKRLYEKSPLILMMRYKDW